MRIQFLFKCKKQNKSKKNVFGRDCWGVFFIVPVCGLYFCGFFFLRKNNPKCLCSFQFEAKKLNKVKCMCT